MHEVIPGKSFKKRIFSNEKIKQTLILEIEADCLIIKILSETKTASTEDSVSLSLSELEKRTDTFYIRENDAKSALASIVFVNASTKTVYVEA